MEIYNPPESPFFKGGLSKIRPFGKGGLSKIPPFVKGCIDWGHR
jgi:hypothetical protein